MLLEILGSIVDIPDWMFYGGLAGAGIIIVIAIKLVWGFFHPKSTDMIFQAWEYLPTGNVPKIHDLEPGDVGPTHFIIREGDKERHILHTHPWVPPLNVQPPIGIFMVPFGSSQADDPGDLYHRNKTVRSPFPIADAQVDAISRIQSKYNAGFSLRKNWFILAIVALAAFALGMIYMSYSAHVPI